MVIIFEQFFIRWRKTRDLGPLKSVNKDFTSESNDQTLCNYILLKDYYYYYYYYYFIWRKFWIIGKKSAKEWECQTKKMNACFPLTMLMIKL